MRLDTLEKKIDVPVDLYNQPAPHFIYERFKFTPGQTSKVFSKKIDVGYFYLVSNVLIKNPIVDDLANDLFSNLTIKIKSVDRNRVHNIDPIDVQQICTPCTEGKTFTAVSPVDNEAFGVEMSASNFRNTISLNMVYLFCSSIFYELQLNKSFLVDKYVDIFIRGYNVPENNHISNIM